MKQHILVIFVNSLMSSDYGFLNQFDNFKYIISSGAIVKRVFNDYPSLKSPAIISALTGEFPCSHGICFDNFNVRVRRYRKKFYEDIRVPTVLDMIGKYGNEVAVISLPVMQRGMFRYNFSKIDSSRFKDVIGGILYGSSVYMLKNIFKYSDVLRIGIQPENDKFSSILAMELLESRKANVIFMELDQLSYVRGRYSQSSDERTLEAIGNLDRKLGDLFSWCDNKGILNSLTMFIVSNGGMYDHRTSININYAFLKNGFLSMSKGKRVKDYIAYAHCDGGSSFIYLKRPNSISDYGKVKVFLNDFAKENSEFISDVYESYGYDSLDLNNFSFILEGKPGCVFQDKVNAEDFIENIDIFNYPLNSNVNKSFYGYSGKYENSNGLFIGYGNKVNGGMCVDKCNIIDVAPTIASFMDLEFKSSGNVVRDMKK